METKTIRIACSSAGHLNLDQLEGFQGELKSLSDENYNKLKTEILDTGFAFPIHIWKDGTHYYIVGGHQRKLALQRLGAEGYTIPPIPVTYVEARDFKEAKRRVLQDVSQYGHIEKEGFLDFLDDAGLDLDDIKLNFDLPDFDFNLLEPDPQHDTEADEEEEHREEGDDAEYDDDELDTIPEVIEPKAKLGELYELGRHRLAVKDCIEFMKTLADNSIDSLVTDPPAGISFMNKNWDDDKGGRDKWIAWLRDVMTEAMRVLKPGAHGLVWALPRTSGWTSMALEDAGFIVKDIVTHIFGSGFPKSHSVSKAIDKMMGAEREIVGKTHCGLHHRGGSNSFTDDKWKAENRDGDFVNVTAAATPEAKQFDGWGTALKPASEHWILVQKPLENGLNIAENCLKWGTGAINIDKTRISTTEKITNHARSAEAAISKGKYGDSIAQDTHQTLGQTLGRWPSNTIFSHSPGCVEVGSKKVKTSTGCENISAPNLFISQNKIGRPYTHYADEDGTETVPDYQCEPGCAVAELGEPARFFYCSKPSKREKNEGCGELPEKQLHGSNRSSSGGFSGAISNSKNPAQNFHPTVKSIKLMQYLITMVSPPNGRVLDPFCGSGTTLVTCEKLGFTCYASEMNPEYADIIIARHDGIKAK